jgi:hypothetical protein
LWKTNNDSSLTPWVRNSEILKNKSHFKNTWQRAHNLKFRKKTILHGYEVDSNIIDLLENKAVTVLGYYNDPKVLKYCQCISPLHIVEEYRFHPVIKGNKIRLRIS